MDRAGQQPTGERDMMFCHECENEWYRDEHGLTCPDCSSDFTEVIEPQHDPRAELIDDDNDDNNLPPNPFGNHDPWAEAEHAPDPDEDDLSSVRWQSTGPGNVSFQFTRTISPNGRQHIHHDGRPEESFPANPVGRSLANMLTGLVGQALTGQQQQQHGQQQQQPDQQAREAGTQDDTTNHAGQGQHNFQGGGANFTWSAQTRIFPRDANNAQPQAQVIADLPALLNQLFNPPPGAGAGAHGQRGNDAFANMGAFRLFTGLMNPANMQHGDAVYSQEALDRIISQLMEQNASGNAPGPASAEAIANLPQKTIAQSDLDDQGKADCSICMDSVNIGDKVTLLPCTHWFHGECIKAWLGEHDTCPHCRQGIMPRDGPADSTAPRNPNQAPRHDVHWGQGEGAGQNPFAAPGSPTRERQASNPASPTGRNGGGLFGRMRDAFGGGGAGAGGSSGP